MIQKVRIQNFKSVLDLEIELGRVNVFIGENGSGKTSVLEGIVMAYAAMSDKLSNEFLSSRGIRVTSRTLMKSAFNSLNLQEEIEVAFHDEVNGSFGVRMDKPDEIGTDWDGQRLYIDSFSLNSAFGNRQAVSLKEFYNILKKMSREIATEDGISADMYKGIEDRMVDKVIERIRQRAIENNHHAPNFSGQDFLLFAPENHFLHRFEEEGQIRPLGIRGEGLFRHLTELAKEAPETLAAISENLQLIDWFEGFSIPNDLQFTERRIAITDRFIKDTIAQIDQRSANEGFLYLLFYFTLFLSKYTPAFFAIDNIDNALNPRLCAKLVQTLVKLAAENDKQAIFTTHNPAVLDGLDLTDDTQRLFVIYRNADGETKARRVMPPKKVEGVEPVRLSEAFVRGYLGGLPKNF